MICISIETILNAIIAIGAIAAAVFAGWAVLQTKKFRMEENKAKRAFLAPKSDPGHITINAEFGEPNGIFINLQNYGVNPAVSVAVRILGYNEADINGENVSPPPIFPPYQAFASNPIPQDAEFNIKITSYFEDGFIWNCLVTGFYVMLIDYDDLVLKCHFKDRFYWQTDKNHNLVEIDHDQRQKLDQLINLYLKTETSNV